jgi:hypothetical protein
MFHIPQLTTEMLLFLAHFSGTGLNILEETPLTIVMDWYESAIKVHNHLNSPAKK